MINKSKTGVNPIDTEYSLSKRNMAGNSKRKKHKGKVKKRKAERRKLRGVI
jgi:hypothetical protein